MAAALDQQSKILTEQTKIMEAQFRHERAVTAQPDRLEVCRALLSVDSTSRLLTSMLETSDTSLAQTVLDVRQLKQDNRETSPDPECLPLVCSFLSCRKRLLRALHYQRP